MALTPAQQQYLDKLNVGSGMGTAGAIGGAGKGASIGTMVAPGIGTAIGAGLGFFGGLFGGKSKAKKAKEEARAKLEQANAEFNQKEDTRLARVGMGEGLLNQLAGKGFTNIDPATAAKLSTRRELDPALVGLTNPGAGAVSGALEGLVGDVGDIFTQRALDKQTQTPSSGGSFLSGLGFSPGAPVGGLDTSFQGTMGTGSSAGVGPNGVSLDDLKNLYKLGDPSSLH